MDIQHINVDRRLYSMKNKIRDSIMNIDEDVYDKLADLQFKNNMMLDLDRCFWSSQWYDDFA